MALRHSAMRSKKPGGVVVMDWAWGGEQATACDDLVSRSVRRERISCTCSRACLVSAVLSAALHACILLLWCKA